MSARRVDGCDRRRRRCMIDAGADGPSGDRARLGCLACEQRRRPKPRSSPRCRRRSIGRGIADAVARPAGSTSRWPIADAAGVGPRPAAPPSTAAAIESPDGHRDGREALRQAGRRRRDPRARSGDRQQRSAGLQRAVAQVLLEVDDDQDVVAPWPRTRRGDDVAPRTGGGTTAAAPSAARCAARRRRRRRRRRRPAPASRAGRRTRPRRLDQGVHRAAERGEADGTGHVDAAGCALVAVSARGGRRCDAAAEREVDEERQAPRHASMSQPPTNGPSAVTITPRPDQVPMARARSPGRNDAEIMARLPGTSSAAAAPCSRRATIRRSAVGAAAHSADVTANPVSR